MKNFLSKRMGDLGWGIFDDDFENFFSPSFFKVGRQQLKTDISQTDKAYELKIDMPGFSKEEIELSLKDGYLMVECKKAQVESDEEQNYIRRERAVNCSRSYFVGNLVKEEDIKAKYNNGILEITVPKKLPEEPKKKTIEIE